MRLVRAITRGYINRPYAEDSPAHEWFRFVLSFPPHLIREYISHFELGEDARVLDPFCGTGTTLVECKKLDAIAKLYSKAVTLVRRARNAERKRLTDKFADVLYFKQKKAKEDIVDLLQSGFQP
jgi:DNA modification methylase